MTEMTKSQFEEQYAHNSGMTIEHFHELGLHAEPCNCDYEKCKGWKVVSQ